MLSLTVIGMAYLLFGTLNALNFGGRDHGEVRISVILIGMGLLLFVAGAFYHHIHGLDWIVS